MDRIPSYLILFTVICGLVFSNCTRKPEVSEKNVSRIIETLSADQMKGRHAFDEEIEHAAAFISSEFEQIGLSPLPGNDDFLQEFSIYTLKPSQASVSACILAKSSSLMRVITRKASA